MQDLVTIGIPVYRAVDFVEASMMSALNQTYPHLEFLVIDDCGGDGTMDVIFRLQMTHPRGTDIRILRNDQNSGPGYSRNRIIEEARGNYLYFMDSDDIIEPNTIEILINAIKQNRAQIAYASYEIINTQNNNPKEVHQKDAVLFEKKGDLALYAFKNVNIFHVSVCNFLVDLSFLRDTGVRFLHTSFWEDMAFTTELVQEIDRAVLLSDITYHYLRRTGSLSHYQDREVFDKNEISKNVSVIDYLKKKCKQQKYFSYIPYLCYNLELNSFYIVCHVLKYAGKIHPSFTSQELQLILQHPLPFYQIIRFKRKKTSNLALWLLGKIPTWLFVPSIILMGKLRKAL